MRALERPILAVAGTAFKAPERLVLAFDGSAATRKGVEMVAASPLFRGMRVKLVMAGEARSDASAQMAWATELLLAGGLQAEGEVVSGEPLAGDPGRDRARAGRLVADGGLHPFALAQPVQAQPHQRFADIGERADALAALTDRAESLLVSRRAQSRGRITMVSGEGTRPSTSRGIFPVRSIASKAALSQAALPLLRARRREMMVPSGALRTSISALGLPGMSSVKRTFGRTAALTLPA